MHFTTYLSPVLLAGAALASPVLPRAVTKSVSTTCSYTSISPSPSPLICGQSGAILKVGTSIMSWAAGDSDQVCLDYCKDTSACVSYSFNSNNNTCEYYDASIKSSNFKKSSSGVYFWNKRCFAQGCDVTTVTDTISSSGKASPSSVKPTISTTSAGKSVTSTDKSVTSTDKSTTSTAKDTTSTGKITTSTAKSATTTEKSTTSTDKITTSTGKITTSTAKTTKATTTEKTSTTSPSAKATCTAPDVSTESCSTLDTSIVGTLLETVTYTLYFSGTGVNENIENPGNTNVLLASTSTTFDGDLSLCDAATMCANQATLLGLTDIYFSFDLGYVKTGACDWNCTLYAGANTDASYFDVKNASVGAVAGYSGVLLDVSL